MINFKSLVVIFLLNFINLHAGLVNAIAISVNSEAITLLDIDNAMQKYNINKNDSVNKLINDILYRQLIKKENIYVDMFDLNDYIKKLAKQNKMKLYEFKNAIQQQESFESFEKKIKKQMIHQKLISAIASNKIVKASTEDMQIYYNNHKNEFERASKINLKIYISKNKKALVKSKQNPMIMQNNVKIQDITLKDEQINPKIRYIISKTSQNTFSSIFVNNKTYNMFYIIKKYDTKIISFKDAKNKIFEMVMKKRQDDFLKEYFNTLRITANIKVLR
jgi:hypothetical protein